MSAIAFWLCKNFPGESLTAGDLSELGARGNFSEFGEFFVWKCF
jgi:hypothetical protein